MKKLTRRDVNRICNTFNNCKSWKETAEIEGISPVWMSHIRKKYIRMKAEPLQPKFDFTK